ncbi:MAG TPA: TonB family protein [Bryobacteraceae bacterium]|nr:TonB family protein [Bryobacteraceae bacterium]
MSARGDILDRPEPLAGSFWASVTLHVSVFAAIILSAWYQAHHPHETWGDLHGGGLGSVSVTPVARIPLPSESGPVNPVANDTKSLAPTPPPKPKAQPKPKVKAPEPDALPLIERKTPRRPAQPSWEKNTYREQQRDQPNQVYSQSGQRMVSPMIGMSGSGGVSMGDNSPFGNQFGQYAELIRNKVGSNWKTGDLPVNLRTAPPVVVTFTITRDGSVPSRSVRITQSSGNQAVDFSAERAVLESSPFPPLPLGYSRDSADIEFHFELRR